MEERCHTHADPSLLERAAAALAQERSWEPLEGLALAEHLRARLAPEVARAAAELVRLRRAAAPRLGPMELLTRTGVEQASRAEVALARARRIALFMKGAQALDATSGVGSDAIALASMGLLAAAMDREELLVRCTRANLALRGLPARVLVGDACTPPARADAVVVDPDRRMGGNRSLEPSAWSPTLAQSLATAARFRGACLKLAPAAEVEVLEAWLPRDLAASWQWVSAGRELCELALWTGALAHPRGWREVLALGRAPERPEVAFEGVPAQAPALEPGRIAQQAFLADPDPALVRSGLLGTFALAHGLHPLAATSAYLLGPEPPASPLVDAFRIVESAPADRRKVRAMLARHDVGPLQVRKRGHPAPADELERTFRGPGARRGILAIARLARGHVALLVERVGRVDAQAGPSPGPAPQPPRAPDSGG